MTYRSIRNFNYFRKVAFFQCKQQNNELNMKMKPYKRTPTQAKILAGMDKVYDNLIEFKKKMNSELVIMQDGKIVRIKP